MLAPDATQRDHLGNANEVLAANPSLQGLVNPEVGGGGFGPSLIGVTTQFASALDMQVFIANGCEPNYQYGLNGVCEPSGQIPDLDQTLQNLRALLSPEQIAAIVQYERGIND